MNFDIKSTSKEDGKEEILHIQSDIKQVIKKLHENTGHSEGKIIRLLDDGIILQTSFYFYEKV